MDHIAPLVIVGFVIALIGLSIVVLTSRTPQLLSHGREFSFLADGWGHSAIKLKHVSEPLIRVCAQYTAKLTVTRHASLCIRGR